MNRMELQLEEGCSHQSQVYLDRSTQNFVAFPDSYYLYARERDGTAVIMARHWLWARICMIFGRSAYKLTHIVPLLTRHSEATSHVLRALQGRVRKYEARAHQKVAAHALLFTHELANLINPTGRALKNLCPPVKIRGVIPLKQMMRKNGPKYFAREARFYFYNSEGVNDLNWGACWRCIQTCLSSLLPTNTSPSIEELFNKFGAGNTLDQLFMSKHKKKHPTKEQKGETQWIEIPVKQTSETNPLFSLETLGKGKYVSPYEEASGRADPFVGEMVLYCYGYDGDLFLLNGLPQKAQAPEQAFQAKIDFKKFYTKLKLHFCQENPSPVMIDDGTRTINIIAFEEDHHARLLNLWILDPALPLETHPTKGLYKIILHKTGWPERVMLSREELLSKLSKEEQESILSQAELTKILNEEEFKSSAEELQQKAKMTSIFQFSEKSWMVLFPKKRFEPNT